MNINGRLEDWSKWTYANSVWAERYTGTSDTSGGSVDIKRLEDEIYTNVTNKLLKKLIILRRDILQDYANMSEDEFKSSIYNLFLNE